jgi:uncharacterized protein YegL
VPDIRGTLLPVYFVADESTSMRPVTSQLSDGLHSLHEALLQESMAAAKVRLCVLGFSDDVVCHLDLVDLRDEASMPRFSVRGGTSYGAAFAALRDRIPNDIVRLKSERYLVHRPAVFFLTDGQPTDEPSWRSIHADLVNREVVRSAPNVLAFGIGAARADTILDVATRPEFAFVATAGVDVGKAVAEFVETLTHSLVTSGQAISAGRGELVVDKPDSFTMAVDLV